MWVQQQVKNEDAPTRPHLLLPKSSAVSPVSPVTRLGSGPLSQLVPRDRSTRPVRAAYCGGTFPESCSPSRVSAESCVSAAHSSGREPVREEALESQSSRRPVRAEKNGGRSPAGGIRERVSGEVDREPVREEWGRQAPFLSHCQAPLPPSPTSPEADDILSLVNEVSADQLGSGPSRGWSRIQMEAGRACMQGGVMGACALE